MPGLSLDVGPGVEQDEVAGLGGHHGGDARPIHAGQRAQLDAGRGDHPTGVAGGEDGVGLAMLDQIHGHGEGALFLAAQPHDRLFIHREDFWRVDDLDSWGEMSRLAKRGADGFLVADEVHSPYVVVMLERPQQTVDNDGATTVSAHDICRDSHKKSATRLVTLRIWR